MRPLQSFISGSIACVLVAVCCQPARAATDPFSLTATGGGTTVTATGSNIVDLASNLIKTQDQFATLSGQGFSASLRYGGLSNAVLVSENSSGTSATVSIPTTGFNKTFTASSESALRDQIRDFFKKEGANQYAAFLRSVNIATTLGVNDGNPLATTALMADTSFDRFGFQSPRFDIGEGPRLPAGLELHARGGFANTDDGDGFYATGGIANTFRLGDRVGLSLGVEGRYRDVEGAAIYQVVNTDALPILLIAPGPDGGLSWTLTPAFVIGFGGSWDLAAGGFPIGGQITSSLAYRTGGWTFVLANQWGYYGGLPISVSDFKFDTDVDQQILKNGVQVIRTFGSFFVDAGVSYTNFLKDAAVENYVSPEAGIGFRFGSASGLRVGYHGDFSTGGNGPDFTTHGGDIRLFLSF